MRSSTRLTMLLALSAGAMLGAACGGGDNNTPDSRVADANKTPDAAMNPDANVQVRTGTLAVTSVNLTDPAVAGLGIGGASISLAFNDLTKGHPHLLSGDPTSLGGCYVFQYDGSTISPAVNTPNPPFDEGVITIEGAGLKEPGPYHCAFVSAAGSYICDGGDQPANPAAAGSYNTTNGNTILTVTGVTFNATDIGKVINLSGITDTNYNHAFPIIGVTSGHPILYTGPIPNTATDPTFTGAAYAVIQGAGPVPGGSGSVNFISTGGAADKVTVSFASNTDYPTAISSSLSPLGKGIKLDGAGTDCLDCAQPHQFPVAAAGGATVSFACNNTVGDAQGDCGEDANPPPLLQGMVVTGSTTDADLTGTKPFDMPAATKSYATFTCTAVGATQIQVDNATIAAILGTKPTRIETRVFLFAFDKKADAATMNGIAIVSGHGLVGHTDVPPVTVQK